MSNFFRDMFYAVATGAIIGTAIRQRRERREALARQAVPPVIGQPRPLRPPRRWRRGQRVPPSGLPRRRWR